MGRTQGLDEVVLIHGSNRSSAPASKFFDAVSNKLFSSYTRALPIFEALPICLVFANLVTVTFAGDTRPEMILALTTPLLAA